MTLIEPQRNGQHSSTTLEDDAAKRQVVIDIVDEFSIYTALNQAKDIALDLKFNNVQVNEIEIAVSELVTNIIKHGGGKGQVRFIFKAENAEILEIEVEDWGKGIDDFFLALEDGYSSGGGGLGGGLPAINRLMDSFKLVSRPGSGASFYATKKVQNKSADPGPQWRFSVYSGPLESEKENGDGYFIKKRGNKSYVFLIDGLGHGIDAHHATQKALRHLENIYHWPEKDIIDVLHQKLSSTRGIVIGLMIVSDEEDTLRFTGIGNIAGYIIGKNSASFLNYSGIVGSNVRKFKTFEYPVESDSVLVLHTDGIKGEWSKSFDRHWDGNLQQFAHKIFTEYSRAADDSSIIVGCKK
ncbi:MAG: ATP-binding protein [FCB group bacterium]|nr:ATP-binding protein [FCB group bacterium]